MPRVRSSVGADVETCASSDGCEAANSTTDKEQRRESRLRPHGLGAICTQRGREEKERLEKRDRSVLIYELLPEVAYRAVGERLSIAEVQEEILCSKSHGESGDIGFRVFCA